MRTISWEINDRDSWDSVTDTQFAYDREPDNTELILPHWFLVFMFAAIAVAPWIRWSNRFSLRTLLIATTLIAVALGIMAMSN